MEFDLSAILATLATIITAWFAYNQTRHDKLTDIKVKEYEKKLERISYKRTENQARILGEMYRLLIGFNCDRVYILQPHPLNINEYISIMLEVDTLGTSHVKKSWYMTKMAEVPKLASTLAQNDLLYLNIDDFEDEDRSKSIFINNGTKYIIAKKLIDSTHDWVGSIICDYVDNCPQEISDEVKQILVRTAILIQYILPKIELNENLEVM